MKLRVPYQIGRDSYGSLLASVVLNVRLSSFAQASAEPTRVMAIVDSGANFCVFSGDVAEELGIVIESGIPAETVGIGGTEVVWFHEITMHLPGGSVAVQAGFQRGLPVAGLLGMNGFFEHFRITFNGASRQCEFERLYES